MNIASIATAMLCLLSDLKLTTDLFRDKSMKIIIALSFLIFNYSIFADVLPEAQSEIKITLAKKPTTRPMTVAFIPGQKKYYIADGGLAPLGSETEALSPNHLFIPMTNLENTCPQLRQDSIIALFFTMN